MSTILYFFHPVSRELLASRVASVIPGIGLEMPNNSTTIAPPVHGVDLAAVFDGEDWSLVEDHRGAGYEKATGKLVTVASLGPVPADITVLPPAPMSTWDESSGSWLPDIEQYRAAKIGELKSDCLKALKAGFDFNGTVYQADPQEQYFIGSAAKAATDTKGKPGAPAQFAVGNTLVDADTAIAIYEAMEAWLPTVQAKLVSLQQAATTAKTVAEISAIAWR